MSFFVIKEVYRVYEKWFEPGRHDRSKKWIYTHKIEKEFGISYRTFHRYLETAKLIFGENKAQIDD